MSDGVSVMVGLGVLVGLGVHVGGSVLVGIGVIVGGCAVFMLADVGGGGNCAPHASDDEASMRMTLKKGNRVRVVRRSMSFTHRNTRRTSRYCNLRRAT